MGKHITSKIYCITSWKEYLILKIKQSRILHDNINAKYFHYINSRVRSDHEWRHSAVDLRTRQVGGVPLHA